MDVAAARSTFTFVLTLILTGGCVERLEKQFIFFPYKTIEETPREWGLTYEDVYFTTEDGLKLNGWWVPGNGSPVTFLWLHGNAGNISHRVDTLKLRRDRLGVNVFIFDYREYGRSEGKVSEEGTYRDGAAAMRYVRARPGLDPSKIVLFGESLGGAVAVEMAIRYGCAALILESPFLSIAEMAKVSFPFLPVGPLLRTKYDTLSKIGKVKAPILIVHGEQDEIVPFRHGRRLFEAASEPKEFYPIRGAHHNDISAVGGMAYLDRLSHFLDRVSQDIRSPRG